MEKFHPLLLLVPVVFLLVRICVPFIVRRRDMKTIIRYDYISMDITMMVSFIPFISILMKTYMENYDFQSDFDLITNLFFLVQLSGALSVCYVNYMETIVLMCLLSLSYSFVGTRTILGSAVIPTFSIFSFFRAFNRLINQRFKMINFFLIMAEVSMLCFESYMFGTDFAYDVINNKNHNSENMMYLQRLICLAFPFFYNSFLSESFVFSNLDRSISRDFYLVELFSLKDVFDKYHNALYVTRNIMLEDKSPTERLTYVKLEEMEEKEIEEEEEEDDDESDDENEGPDEVKPLPEPPVLPKRKVKTVDVPVSGVNYTVNEVQYTVPEVKYIAPIVESVPSEVVKSQKKKKKGKGNQQS